MVLEKVYKGGCKEREALHATLQLFGKFAKHAGTPRKYTA